MSDTPRTDKEEIWAESTAGNDSFKAVDVDFARELERELNQVRSDAQTLAALYAAECGMEDGEVPDNIRELLLAAAMRYIETSTRSTEDQTEETIGHLMQRIFQVQP